MEDSHKAIMQIVEFARLRLGIFAGVDYMIALQGAIEAAVLEARLKEREECIEAVKNCWPEAMGWGTLEVIDIAVRAIQDKDKLPGAE